jgi:hypothetical protein
MPTRERWIVYPLLLLILGMVLRDKLIPPKHLSLEQLRATEIVAPTVLCGRLIISGPNGRPVVIAGTDTNTGAGVVETFATDGLPQVRLSSADTGGIVTTIGHEGKLLLETGHRGQNFGVFAETPDMDQVVPLTLPGTFGIRPTPPKTGNTHAAADKPSNASPQKKKDVEKEKKR